MVQELLRKIDQIENADPAYQDGASQVRDLVTDLYRDNKLPLNLEQNLVVGDVSLNLLSKAACYHGEKLPLLPQEFSLLARLIATPEEAVTYQELIQLLWQDEENHGREINLRICASITRRKIKRARLEIINIKQTGYLLKILEPSPNPVPPTT